MTWTRASSTTLKIHRPSAKRCWQCPHVIYARSAGGSSSSESGRYVMVWEHHASSNYDIRGQVISPAGTLEGGSYVTVAGGQDERYPRLARGGLAAGQWGEQ